MQKDLDDCIREFYAFLSMFLGGYQTRNTTDMLYDSGEENVFTKKVDCAVKKIEEYLKPHLK